MNKLPSADASPGRDDCQRRPSCPTTCWHATCERNLQRVKTHPRNTTMKSSNQDKTEGTGKDIGGKIKEGAGNLVGNESLQAEGQADQAEGKIQKKVGDVKKVFDK
jgi:uncharacterized protein YjbJ (UPF0337 family)